MVSCCVPGCSNTSIRTVGLSYFRLPKDDHSRAQWIAAIEQNAKSSNDRKRNIQGLKDARVCAMHFPGSPVKSPLDIPTIFIPTKVQRVKDVNDTLKSPVQLPLSRPNPVLNIVSKATKTQAPLGPRPCQPIQPQFCPRLRVVKNSRAPTKVVTVVDLTQEPRQRDVETQTEESREIAMLRKELEAVKRRLRNTEITLQAVQDLVASKFLS